MIHTHPGQPQMQAEVILASYGNTCFHTPLYTIRLRYPRIIHAEIMTHRVFSRNARSSRAVPVKTMLNKVRSDPFVPWHWGKNQKGMQAGEDCNEPVYFRNYVIRSVDMRSREETWLWARDKAVDAAEAMMNAGYHKQIPNRLLEPFSWIDTLITATDWDNFLHLRDHKDAEPHLQDLARLVRHAIDHCEYQTLHAGEWHLPYITLDDVQWAAQQSHLKAAAPARNVGEVSEYWTLLCKISAARCARISYAPFDGDASYERELERYDSLVKSDRIHASPLEHQAMLDDSIPVFKDGKHIGEKFDSPHLSGNLAPGWTQYRKTVPGESV